MKKFGKFAGAAVLMGMLVFLGTVIADRQSLRHDLIRLHVVAASDSAQDQAQKLLVRDAILENLQAEMSAQQDAAEAAQYLEAQLPRLQKIALDTLQAAGAEETVTVTLTEEAFPTRNYDTFSLPAGVYQSLRITIGQGGGENWWCVVFPSLCLPATSQGFADTAVGAGFADSLTDALRSDDGHTVRFFFLDCFGWLENLFHKG